MSVKQERTKNFAQRTFTSEVIKRQRTALVSLSLVLLIYALAGGHMRSDVTLLNLPISFKRPIVLLVAAWVIWAYFLYRYLLVTDSQWKALTEEVRLRALADRKVHSLCLPALPRFDIPVDWRATAHRQIAEGWTLSIVKHDGRYHFDPGQFFRPSTQASGSGGPGQIGYFPLTSSEVWTYRRALVRATFKAILLEHTFSEAMVPYFLIWVTPLTWIAVYAPSVVKFFQT